MEMMTYQLIIILSLVCVIASLSGIIIVERKKWKTDKQADEFKLTQNGKEVRQDKQTSKDTLLDQAE